MMCIYKQKQYYPEDSHMPKNTGIKKRLDYINRVLAEDTELADKDKLYGTYIAALTNLVEKTNAVYDNDGNFLQNKFVGSS